jgi:GTPase KRas protein
MLVGNKCDRAYDRQVTREEGMEMARTFGCEFLETSAKTAVNVERLFASLVRKLRENRHGVDGRPPGSVQAAPRKKKPSPKCIIL